MGKPYADDLRLVVIRLIEEGHSASGANVLVMKGVLRVRQPTPTVRFNQDFHSKSVPSVVHAGSTSFAVAHVRGDEQLITVIA
jgi:hypothetical protein